MINWFKNFGLRHTERVVANPPPAPISERPAELRIQTKWLDQAFAEIDHRGRTMRFATTGKSSVKRVRSLFDKEPITLAWIDSFTPDQVLCDVGANVGMYTIYAAIMRQAQVYAFEPEALNYAELERFAIIPGHIRTS